MQRFLCTERGGAKSILPSWLFSDFYYSKNKHCLIILASKIVCKLGNKMQSSIFTFPLFPLDTVKAGFQWNNLLTTFVPGEYWWLLSNDYRYSEKC